MNTARKQLKSTMTTAMPIPFSCAVTNFVLTEPELLALVGFADDDRAELTFVSPQPAHFQLE